MADSRQSSLAEQVMAYVRRAVDSGEMVPGAWYSAYQLADVLGFSRSPVREGLLRLEESGLIRFTRNRGFQVVETTPADIAEYFSLRLAIEPAAASRAAQTRTPAGLAELDELTTRLRSAEQADDAAAFFAVEPDLHSLVLRFGHSNRGAELIAQLYTHTRLPGAAATGETRSLSEILSEQIEVIEAIREQKPRAAKAAMTSHLRNSGRLRLAHMMILAGDNSDPELLWRRYTDGY